MIASRSLLRLRLAKIDPLTGLLLGLWVLAMISLPIVTWTLGQAALQPGIVTGVLIQVAVVLVTLWRAWGWQRTALTGLTVVSAAWTAEAVGSATGVPFGDYHYTEALRPQLAGVPLLIPLAWLMMLPPAWAVASLIVGSRRRLLFIGASAVTFTAWDLFLDPQMVAWQFWAWAEPAQPAPRLLGAYFGVPWINFLGWLLVSAAITALVRPRNLPLPPLLLVYTITWALETSGLLLFWGLPGPAVVGFFAMGAPLLAAWRAYRRPG